MGYLASPEWRAKYHATVCPTCNAQPGKPCMTQSGYITRTHKTRPRINP